MSVSTRGPGLSLLILIAAMGFLPLVRGGYPLWPQACFGALAAIGLLLAPRPDKARPDPLFHCSVLIWICWLLWQGVQILALPPQLLQQWAPASYAMWNAALAAGASAPLRISVAPDAALNGLIASAGLFCFYLALRSNLLADTQRRTFFLLSVVTLGAMQAIYGTVAHLTDWQLSWLEPAPPAHSSVAHGSFPNRNHYAAYLLIAFACALILVLGESRRKRPRWHSRLRRWLDLLNGPVLLLRTAMLSIVIAIILTQSRMGNASLALGVSLFGIIWLIKTADVRSFGRALILFCSIAVIDVLLVSQHFGLERVLERIEDTDLDESTRSAARSMSLQLIGQFGATGAGHGSFALLEHQTRPDYRVGYLHHAHNDHLELILEFGGLGYGLLACLVIVHLGMAIRALNSPRSLSRACGAGLIMIISAALLHATVEFLFHVPGWRALFVAMLAVIASFQATRRSRKRPERRDQKALS